jgi:hypothetical protein
MNARKLAGLVAFVFALGLGGPAAGQSHHADYDHVLKVQANKNKYLYVSVPGNFWPTHGCSQNPTYVRSQNKIDDPQTQAVLQIALSSLLARTPVHVWTEGCDGNTPILTQIQIQERQPPPPPTVPPQQPKRCSNAQQCCGPGTRDACEGVCWPANRTCPDNP